MLHSTLFFKKDSLIVIYLLFLFRPSQAEAAVLAVEHEAAAAERSKAQVTRTLERPFDFLS